MTFLVAAWTALFADQDCGLLHLAFLWYLTCFWLFEVVLGYALILIESFIEVLAVWNVLSCF